MLPQGPWLSPEHPEIWRCPSPSLSEPLYQTEMPGSSYKAPLLPSLQNKHLIKSAILVLWKVWMYEKNSFYKWKDRTESRGYKQFELLLELKVFSQFYSNLMNTEKFDLFKLRPLLPIPCNLRRYIKHVVPKNPIFTKWIIYFHCLTLF